MSNNVDIKAKLQNARRFANTMTISKTTFGGYDKDSVRNNIKFLADVYEKSVNEISFEYDNIIDEKDSEIKELGEKVNELDERLRLLTKNLITSEQEIDLQKDNTVVEEKPINNYDDKRVEELEKELEIANRERDELKFALDNAKSEQGTLRQALDNANDTIESMRITNNYDTVKSKELEESLEAKMRECDERTALIAKVMIEAQKTADRIVAQAQQEADNMKAEIELERVQYNRMVDKMTDDRKDWRSTIDDILAELESLRANVEQTREFIEKN